MIKPIDKTFVALDNMSDIQIREFLKKAQDIPYIKIGLEMFCAKGPEFIKELYNDFGKEIFLDLKLHDIPNTVAKSIRSLKGLPIKLLTIHLSGGREMIKQAVAEAKISLPNTDLLGVSFLTSLGAEDMREIWGIEQPQEAFTRLFNLAMETNIQGLVLSAQELELLQTIEDKYQKKVIKLCPGIRFKDEINGPASQDQKRVETPESAIAKGATYLVIGRSLTQAQDLPSRITELQKPLTLN